MSVAHPLDHDIKGGVIEERRASTSNDERSQNHSAPYAIHFTTRLEGDNRNLRKAIYRSLHDASKAGIDLSCWVGRLMGTQGATLKQETDCRPELPEFCSKITGRNLRKRSLPHACWTEMN
jgi:hypothetical protein